MKLYTEEQVKQMIEKSQHTGLTAEYLMLTRPPIELPSDVEVGKIVLGNSPLMEHRDSGYFAAGAMKYNQWLKEQLENK